MAKIVKLQQPKSATVELAEKLLADCKAGVVIGFAYAAVCEGIAEVETRSASAFAPAATSLDHKLMVCAIEEMRHEFKHALRGG